MKTKIYLVIIVLVMGSILIQKKTSGNVNISVNGPGSLTGKIVEEVSTLPLEMVTVVLYSSTDSSMVVGTISNMDGSFSIWMKWQRIFKTYDVVSPRPGRISPI